MDNEQKNIEIKEPRIPSSDMSPNEKYNIKINHNNTLDPSAFKDFKKKKTSVKFLDVPDKPTKSRGSLSKIGDDYTIYDRQQPRNKSLSVLNTPLIQGGNRRRAPSIENFSSLNRQDSATIKHIQRSRSKIGENKFFIPKNEKFH